MNRHIRHRSRITAAIGAALLVAMGIAASFWVEHVRFQSAKTAVEDADAIARSGNGVVTDLSSVPGTNGHMRWVFGHSLVPGGIHSIAELAVVTSRDAKLAEHYQDFDLSKGRLITLDHDVLGFVSYRLDGAIYWEKRPTVIAKGEQVLTDGSNVIRGRCGNRIAASPHFPVSPAEPTDMDIVVGKLTEPPDVTEPTDPTDVSEVPQAPETPVKSAEVPDTQPAPGASLLPPGPAPAQPTPIWAGPLPTPPAPPTTPPIPPPPRYPPFGGDEFSNVSVTILGHNRSIPTELLTLAAGIALVTVLRLALWRS